MKGDWSGKKTINKSIKGDIDTFKTLCVQIVYAYVC